MFTYLGICYLGMLFDMLLFRHVKHFVAGLPYLVILHLAFFLLTKFTSSHQRFP